MPATTRQGMPVWATLLAEFFLVIVAVMLALWAGEMVKANERKADAATTLEKIYNEVRGNRYYLTQLHEQHKGFAENFDDSFKAMIDLDPLKATPEELATISIVPFRGWDAAWKLAEAKGTLSAIEYDYAVAITSAYSMQEIYADFGKEFLSVAFDLDYRDPEREEQVRDAMKSTLTTFLTFNEALIKSYDDTLKKLEAHPDLDLGKEE